MPLQWCLLFIVLLLNNPISLTKSSQSLEEFSSTTASSTDKEGLDKENGNNEENGTESNEVSSSKEEEGSMKTEAMYRDDFDRRYGYRPYSDYDRYGNRRWNQQRRWRDFSYRRHFDIYSGRDQFFWPRQENRWEFPQDDEWNFGALSGDKCNNVNLKEVPDQPNRYSDQAFDVPPWRSMKFDDFNVSSFDVYQERCCQGKTYPKYPNGQYACCGSSDYDTVREVCCDGKKHPRQLTYECCGENYINADTEICCYHPTNGIGAKPLPASTQDHKEIRLFRQCCGDELYNTRSHLCFLVTSRYDEVANFTVVEKKYNRTGCCEGKPYDQDAENCNETGKTYTFLTGPPCVFKQAYEQVQKQIRLRDSEKERRYYRTQFGPNFYRGFRDPHYNNLISCGDQMYSPYTQMCCGDRYREKENGTVKVWDRTGWSSCCGTEIYSYHTHRCCDGRIVEKLKGFIHDQECCGQQLYSRRKQWCCEGSNTVIDAQRDQGERCCGPEGLVFNTSTHVCCNNRLSEIPEDRYRSRRWQCCRSNDSNQPDQVYHSYRAKCCNGVLHNISRYAWWQQECCGSEMYNVRRSTCCGGKIYNQTSCCSNKEPYNPRTHRCCDGSVVEKPSTYSDSCCGKIAYDGQLQTCCFDRQANVWQTTCKKSRRETCCGGKPYDPDRQSCCGSSLIIEDRGKSMCCDLYDPDTGNYSFAVVEKKVNATSSSCCGKSAYDRTTEVCCKGNVISDRNMTCCGANGYNRESQLCCYGEVHDRSEDDNKKCCGKNVYDVTKEICCHGVALPVNDVNTAMCCYDKPQQNAW